MDKPTNQTEEQKLITLAGGKNIELAYRDGRTETVLIRKVSLRNMDQLGKAWGNFRDEFRVYTGLPETAIETITEESFLSVIEEGRALNFTCFERWMRLSMQTIKPFGEGGINLDVLMQKAVEAMQEKTSS